MHRLATFATLFAGGGLADIGMRQAGLTPLWAVESNADIAAVYRANHGDHVIVADVRQVEFAALPAPDLLWLSPPCPSFSVANTRRGETQTDRAIAEACCRAIVVLKPRAVILENVRGYARSESFLRIRATLDSLDYWSHAQVVNAADCGTPQTRERLLLRAVAGGLMQAHRPWPAPVRWRGWYGAVEDLLPSLPSSAFAPWQLSRLPEELRGSLLFEGCNAGGADRLAHEPAGTVTPSHPPRAFILDGQTNANGTTVTRRDDAEPCFMISTGSGQRRVVRAWLSEGRVVALTPRCLARLQGVPDSYRLPDKKALACRIIGNGVAVDVARVAVETLQ